MKIRWYDRILLFIIALFLLACAALFVSIALFPAVNKDVVNRVVNLSGDKTGSAMLIAGGAILLVLTIYLFCISFSKKKAAAPKSVIVRQSEVGSIEITISALDTLVQKCARGFSEVRDCLSAINVTQFNDIVILVRLHILPDIDIPEMTARMQKEMKEYVESMSGITVREVKVMVESSGVNPGARVQ